MNILNIFNGLPIGYTNCHIKGTIDPENAKEYIKNLNKKGFSDCLLC